jgi:hypothetical protein
MISLIAAIYLIVSGVAEPDRAKEYFYKNQYATVEECEAARESDEVKAGVEQLRAYLEANNPGVEFEIKTVCEAR